MSTNRDALFARLRELGIPTTTVEHPPMFTVEQSASLREEIPGAHTKNLFLTDKDGHRVLVVAKDDTRVDLRALAQRLGAGRFSFAKGELLEAVTRCSSRFGYAVGADPSGGGGRDRSIGPFRHPVHR